MTNNQDKAFFKKLNKTIKVQLDPALSDAQARAIHTQIANLPDVKKIDWVIQHGVDPAQADSPDDLYRGAKKHTKEMMVDIFGPSKRLTHEFDALARKECAVDALVKKIAAIPGVIDAHPMHKGPFRGWVPVKPASTAPKA